MTFVKHQQGVLSHGRCLVPPDTDTLCNPHPGSLKSQSLQEHRPVSLPHPLHHLYFPSPASTDAALYLGISGHPHPPISKPHLQYQLLREPSLAFLNGRHFFLLRAKITAQCAVLTGSSTYIISDTFSFVTYLPSLSLIFFIKIVIIKISASWGCGKDQVPNACPVADT